MDADKFVAEGMALLDYCVIGRQEPFIRAHLEAGAAEIRRLTEALKKANNQAEHFERAWYLRGDEFETLRELARDAMPDNWADDSDTRALALALGISDSEGGTAD